MQPLLDAIVRADPGQDACRIFHGRGGLYPGCEHLSLDWYAPVWVLTSFQPLSEADLQTVQTVLAQRPEPLNWVYQCRQPGEARIETRLMAGSVPEPHVVTEQGARYRVHVLKGQNHGLFLDMACGRQWLRQHAQNTRVLNLFAYTCAFSVAALQGGASEVVNVDMAAGALAIGQHNHQLNDLAGGRFLAHDLFKSPEIPSHFLLDLVASEAPGLRFVRRLENPAAFEDAQPERALKVMLFENHRRG